MALMGWGWNLMVRRTQKALKMIRRGYAGTYQASLAERVAAKSFTGQRAAKVLKLTANGAPREQAEKTVRREMASKAFAYRGSRLAMEWAMLAVESAKQGQMGSTLGSAWSQLKIKYQNAWEACWKRLREAPVRRRIQDAGWLQAQMASVPAELMFLHPEPHGPFRENWIDLGRFFPERLTKTPERIKKAPASERERLKAEFQALARVRLLQHRPLPAGAIVKDLKITRSNAGPDAEWHVVLAVEVPEASFTKIFPVTGKACGINPARRHALTVVGEDHLAQGLPGQVGEEIGPGHPLARTQRKLRRLQRKLDRQRRANNPHCFDEKGRWIKGQRLTVISKGMQETESEIRALHRQVANQRKEAYHRVVNNLLTRYDTVYLGDWKSEAPKVRRAKKKVRKATFAKDGSQRKKGEAALEKLGNSMDRENALGVFRQILAEKVARSGGFKSLVKTPEPYTTQPCAACGELTGPKGFSPQGWWTCTACGHRQYRGRTAAYWILQKGPQSTSEQAPEGTGPVPKTSSGKRKGAGQALKGGSDPAVGRMPSDGGKGASASRPARRNRKASTLVDQTPVSAGVNATGSLAPIQANSQVTSSGGRGTEIAAVRTAVPGMDASPSAGTARLGLQGNQGH